jgi:hypothetical protein
MTQAHFSQTKWTHQLSMAYWSFRQTKQEAKQAMCPIPYYTMRQQSKDPKYIRLEMVRWAKERGIKPTARYFATTVKTVRKWLRRWQPGTLQGLEEKSRAPKNPRQRIHPKHRQRLS